MYGHARGNVHETSRMDAPCRNWLGPLRVSVRSEALRALVHWLRDCWIKNRNPRLVLRVYRSGSESDNLSSCVCLDVGLSRLQDGSSHLDRCLSSHCGQSQTCKEQSDRTCVGVGRTRSPPAACTTTSMRPVLACTASVAACYTSQLITKRLEGCGTLIDAQLVTSATCRRSNQMMQCTTIIRRPSTTR